MQITQESQKLIRAGIEAARNRNLETAEYYLLQALELEPGARTYSALGWFYGQIQTDSKKAENFLYRAVLCDAACADYSIELGIYLYRNHRLPEAARWLFRSLRCKHGNHRYLALYHLALVYCIWNRPERCLRYLHLTLRMKPDFAPAKNLLEKLKLKG